jgi:ribose transport system permease protein
VTVTTGEPTASGFDWRAWARRKGWTVGVWLLLVILIAWYAALIPSFGSFQIASIAKNSLPLVYLSIAQAVIVIAGGIDLSVGAMLVLTNAVAAQMMDGQPVVVTLLVAVVVIIGAAILNGTVGWIINVSRVPDIVVTLATSFTLSGVALLVLPSPGGGTSDGFRAIFTGSSSGVGSNFWPALVMMAIPVVLAALFMRRTRQGLALYATGSATMAAFFAGVDTARAKIVSYAVGGAFGAMAGLSALAITGSGESRFSTGANATLRSVAAIVLGGIALSGGVGSVVGAAAAGIILFSLSPILSAMGIDPNTAQVIQGSLIVVVMMIAGLIELRRQRAQ